MTELATIEELEKRIAKLEQRMSLEQIRGLQEGLLPRCQRSNLIGRRSTKSRNGRRDIMKDG